MTHQTQQMSLVEKRAFLDKMKLRARLHRPATATRLQAEIGQMLDSLKTGTPEEKANLEEARKQYSDMMVAAANGDQAVRAELAKIRILRVNNFLTATSNVMRFFENITLADNEAPYIVNDTRQQIMVNYIGEDGGFRRTQPIKSQSQYPIPLHEIATEEYEYPLRDIMTGKVADDAKANVDMAFDLERAIEAKVWPYLKKLIGAFVLTGPLALQTYVVNNAVNVKNLPKTNLLVPDPAGTSPNTSTSLWRKECMDAVLQYVASWGNALPGGQMKPQVVYIPSSEVMGFLKQITMTSQPNGMVEQVIDDGFVMHYGGQDWVFVGDPTLDPDAGLAYVQMTTAAGKFFTKPGMDQTFDDNSIANQKQNKGVLSMTKVIGVATSNVWRPNVCAVQYHTAR